MTAKLAKSFFQLILYYFNPDYIVFLLYICVYIYIYIYIYIFYSIFTKKERMVITKKFSSCTQRIRGDLKSRPWMALKVPHSVLSYQRCPDFQDHRNHFPTSVSGKSKLEVKAVCIISPPHLGLFFFHLSPRCRAKVINWQPNHKPVLLTKCFYVFKLAANMKIQKAASLRKSCLDRSQPLVPHGGDQLS